MLKFHGYATTFHGLHVHVFPLCTENTCFLNGYLKQN